MFCARADAISSPASGAGPCGSNASSKRCSAEALRAGVATGGPACPDGRVTRSLRERSPTARISVIAIAGSASPTISYSISPLPITVAPVSASPASTIEIIGMLLTGDSLRIVAGTGMRAGRVMTSNAVSARAVSTDAAPVGKSRRSR